MVSLLDDGRLQVIALGANRTFFERTQQAPGAGWNDWQQVVDKSLVASSRDVRTSQGHSFTGVVASFFDVVLTAPASAYTATVAWGDGQTSAGRIVSDGSGGFNVTGTHVYARTGSFTPRVTIRDREGTTVTVSNSTAVVLPPSGSSPGSGAPPQSAPRAPSSFPSSQASAVPAAPAPFARFPADVLHMLFGSQGTLATPQSISPPASGFGLHEPAPRGQIQPHISASVAPLVSDAVIAAFVKYTASRTIRPPLLSLAGLAGFHDLTWYPEPLWVDLEDR